MAEIPTLETERLLLRGHTVDDLAPCTAMWADLAVTRHIGGKPFTREESWARLLRYAGHWKLLGYGFWAVVEKSTGRFIGETGIANFERELDSPLRDCPEMGWVMAPDHHGKGFASEAVQAVIAWGDRHFGGAKTFCMIDPDNLPSIRVAEKVGYRKAASADYKGSPILLFSREGRTAG